MSFGLIVRTSFAGFSTEPRGPARGEHRVLLQHGDPELEQPADGRGAHMRQRERARLPEHQSDALRSGVRHETPLRVALLLPSSRCC